MRRLGDAHRALLHALHLAKRNTRLQKHYCTKAMRCTYAFFAAASTLAITAYSASTLAAMRSSG